MNIWKDVNRVDILLRRLAVIEEDNNWKLKKSFFNTCGREGCSEERESEKKE